MKINHNLVFIGILSVFISALSFFLSGCGGSNGSLSPQTLLTPSFGGLEMKVDWPGDALSAQLIPTDTVKIDILITGIPSPVTVTLLKGETTRTITDLPPGDVTLEFKALDGNGKILSHRITTVKVIAGQTVSVTVILGITILPAGFVPSSMTVNIGDIIYFVNNDTVPHTVSLDGLNNSGPIPPGGEYAFKFTGNPNKNYTFSFEGHTCGVTVTGGSAPYIPPVPPVPTPQKTPYWGANERVDDGPGNASASNPNIAVDTSGNAYAVWVDNRNGNYDIYFSYRPSGGVWSASERVDDDTGTATAYSPRIAVDPSGNAYAVWTDYRNVNGDIYFSYRPSGGAWGASERVDNAPAGLAATNPSIGVDPSGNAYAVWRDERSGNRDIYFSYRPSGGAWGASERVDDAPGTAGAYTPSIAVDPSGNAYAVWQDERSGNSEIFFSYRPSGGVWSANVRVDDATGTVYASDPSIGVDPSGNAYAVWTDYRIGNGNIYFSYRPSGGIWSANVRVDDAPDTASLAYPAIGVNPSGNAYAVWQDSRNGSWDIYSSYRPSGGIWSANVRVDDATGTTDAVFPSIGVDPSGNAYAVWRDERNGNEDIYFSIGQ